jgi:excisionase family DNA binding protein
MALRHLSRALDDHASWCKTNGYTVPRALVDLRLLAASSSQEQTDVGPADLAVDDGAMRRLLTYREAADRLGVGERTVARLVKAKELPSVSIGASKRIDSEDVDAFMDSLKASA